jgi:hypothetical protein
MVVCPKPLLAEAKGIFEHLGGEAVARAAHSLREHAETAPV